MSDRSPASEAALARRLAKTRNAPPRRPEIPLDERIAKCPQPVRDHITTLEHRARAAEARADAMEALASDHHPVTDAVVTWPGHEDIPDRPLPPGATVTFGDQVQATWNLADATDIPARLRGTPALLVDAMGQIEIVPLDGERVLIRERG